MVNLAKNLLIIGIVCTAPMMYGMDKKSTSSVDSPRNSPKNSPKRAEKNPKDSLLTSSSGVPKTSVKTLSELQAIMAKKQSDRAQSEGSGSIK